MLTLYLLEKKNICLIWESYQGPLDPGASSLPTVTVPKSIDNHCSVVQLVAVCVRISWTLVRFADQENKDHNN